VFLPLSAKRLYLRAIPGTSDAVSIETTPVYGERSEQMSKRIITVDDSASVRQMVSFTLKDAGYEVMEASDGRDALTKLNGSSVHMVITDLNMPNLDGIGLIKELRAQPAYKFIPIVMLTTESQDSKKQEGKSAGATGWIVKPFKSDQLLAVVRKVLG
jgi:two-component system chemotaxis response regulator CheY